MEGGGTVWLSALFVNQGQMSRWYRDDVGRLILIIFENFCKFYICHLETAIPVTCGEYLMVIRTFRQPRRTSRLYRDDVGRPILIIY